MINFVKYLILIFGNFLFHVRCVCNIFNLVVLDDMRHIKNQIDRIMDALIYITTLPSRKQVFEELG